MIVRRFLSGLFLSALLILVCVPLAAQDMTVKSLVVEDVPDDDGTGLQISWEPLPKEARIIEYRVYRGVSSDSLFFIGRIPVNPKTGVASDRMYFYDKSYNYFLDVRASGKLKKEKQQPEDSPLYQELPKDLAVTGPMLKHYRILGVIPKKEFYYHTTKVEREVPDEEDGTADAEEEGDEEDDGPDVETYAGLEIRQLSMYKKLIPDHDYYYTVLAVNKTGKFLPYCEPQKGAPRNNAPEKTKEFYSVYVSDLNRLQFEWSLPLNNEDIRTHNVYMMHKDDLPQFEQYVKQIKQEEMNLLASKIDTSAVIPPIENPVDNPATLIFTRPTAYPYTSVKTCLVDIEANEDGTMHIYDEDNGIDVPFDPAMVGDYLFVFSLIEYPDENYPGYETFSEPILTKTITDSDLPELPAITVEDKENDKGDYNTIYWGKPIVNLSKAVILKEQREEDEEGNLIHSNIEKLLVNYEMQTNKHYKVYSIYFDVFDKDGNLIDTVNEFYQDNKIKISSSNGYNLKDGVSLAIRFHTDHDDELGEGYTLSQDLYFNDISRSMEPGDLMHGDEIVDDYYYMITKQPASSSNFREAKKLTGFMRQLDDTINYERSIFKGVSEYDLEKNMLLVSPPMSVRYDYENDTSISIPIYGSVLEENMEDYQETVDEYTAKRDSAATEQDKERYQMFIDHYSAQLNNEDLKKARGFKSDKNRNKFIAGIREHAARNFKYRMIKSDGQAAFRMSEVYQDANGNERFFPVPNWFDTSKWAMLIATVIFGFMVFYMISRARKGHDFYLRPIAGIEEIDNAIGRATEMGRPILFVPSMSGISDVATLAALSILGKVAKKAAEYDTKLIVPCRDYIVMPIAQEIVKEAHYEAGRPDTFDKGSVFFLTTSQFAYVAGVNGIMIRERTATNFYLGMFYAESLIMTETGSNTGAIQIAGTDAVTQIPFFITTCDYTLIGEELYAAAAYLAREPLMMGTLKAQDYAKFIILALVIIGTALSSSHLTFFIRAFPDK